jgi:uncharacterized protein (TIRG00374 family)
MSRAVKNKLGLILGLLVSVGCLALVTRNIHLDAVAQAVTQADPLWLAAGILLTVGGIFLRAARWVGLFTPQRLPFAPTFDALSVGYLVSNLLPARLGDVARIFLIGDWAGANRAHALATVIVERVMDMTVILALLVGLMPWLQLPAWAVRSAQGAALAVIVAVLLLWLAAGRGEEGSRLVERILGRLPRVDAARWAGIVLDWSARLRLLRTLHPGLTMLALTAVIWIEGALSYYAVLRAFHLPVGPLSAVFVLCVEALGMAVPSSPGNVGVFEYAGVAALSIFQAEPAVALAAVLTLHAVVYLSLSGAGLLSLWRRSLSYGGLMARVEGRGAPLEIVH